MLLLPREIKKECVFNALEDFHATDNLSIDIMHDLFEGVCVLDMADIIKYFTKVANFFILDFI